MDELLLHLFNVSKRRFYAYMEDENCNRLFKLIDKINTSENKDKNIDSFSYSQILYSIFNFYSSFNWDIHIRNDFTYIISVLDFLRDIDWCITDDGQLYFVKFTVKYNYPSKLNRPPLIFPVYTFSSRQYDDNKWATKDFCKNASFDTIIGIERLSVGNYELLFSILSEILNDDNWVLKTYSGRAWYEFDIKLAFDKYFGKE